MKYRVHIFLKEGVFDPQGNTVCASLKQMGFKTVSGVRIGKAIDIELSAETEGAMGQIHEMCQKLLVNETVESYRIEKLEGLSRQQEKDET